MKKLFYLLFAGIYFATPISAQDFNPKKFKDNINQTFEIPKNYENYENKILFPPIEITDREKMRTSVMYALPFKGIFNGRINIIEFFKLVSNKNAGLDRIGDACVLYDLEGDGSFKDKYGKYYAKGDCDW